MLVWSSRSRACVSLVIPAVVLLASAMEARAQRVEVQPFVGARFGGTFTVDETIPGGERPVDLSTDDGIAWGATVGVSIGASLGLEFMWSRQASAITAQPLSLPEATLFDAAVSQYHGNVLVHFLDRERRVRPYLLFGVGGTTIDPDVDGIESLNKVSYSFGGGLKAYFSDHVGIRLQGRFTPTYISSSPAIFCDVFAFCYLVEDAHYLSQGEVSAGITIRF